MHYAQEAMGQVLCTGGYGPGIMHKARPMGQELLYRRLWANNYAQEAMGQSLCTGGYGPGIMHWRLWAGHYVQEAMGPALLQETMGHALCTVHEAVWARHDALEDSILCRPCADC